MKYYKGYLDKEYVRKQLHNNGKELWGQLLTEFMYELEKKIELEMGYKIDDIVRDTFIKNKTLDEVSK